MSIRRAVVVASLLLALVAACGGGTSRTSTCSDAGCTVSLSGEQTIKLTIARVERDLSVGPIEANAVTVSARGEQARLAVGETGTVGGLAVRVTSVSGRDVGLEVRRS